MDQHIPAVIINRKENQLKVIREKLSYFLFIINIFYSKKGAGYHLDLLVVAVAIGINSFIGLPWFVAGRFMFLKKKFFINQLINSSINKQPCYH